MTPPLEGYIIRLSHVKTERQLFLQRELLIGVRRNWSCGVKTLFLRKQEAHTGKTHERPEYRDYFIGSGIVERLVELDGLTEIERQRCAETNCYGKIIFRTVVRLVPPIPAESILRPSMENTVELARPEELEKPLQTGASFEISDIERVERLADVRIFS